MNTNLYVEFRDEYAFDVAKSIIEMPSEWLNGEALEQFESAQTESISSILSGLTWEDLNRAGIRTRRGTTFVPYNYERPEVHLRVHAEYGSESQDLEKIGIKLDFKEIDGRFLIKWGITPEGHVSFDLIT